MSSNAIPAYGTLLKRGTGTAGTTNQSYQLIGEVKNTDGPSTEVSTIDVTTHSSAASGNFREFIPSLIDPGTIDVELNWVHSDSTHRSMWTDMNNRTLRDYRVEVPADRNGATCNMDFQGYVTSYAKTFPVDDVVGANLSIRITGQISENYSA